jgi:hypothetical protein
MLILNKKKSVPKFAYPEGYKLTGNIAVDMLVACIYDYSKKNRRLKSISPLPILFELLQDWTIKEFGKDAYAQEYELYGVTIKMGSPFQTKELMIEFAVTPVKT